MTLADRRRDIPPFSRIAYQNMGNDLLIVEKLTREMETWVKSKKSVDDLIDRIRSVTGMSYNQARRVAQTERTRVQGQARYEAIKELNKTLVGKRRYRKEWIARRDDRTRDTHAEISGSIVRANEYFVMSSGAKLMYPGDPRAPAEEVINCRCYIRKVAPRKD